MKFLSFLFILRRSKGLVALVLVSSALSGLCSTAMIALVNSALNQPAASAVKIVWAFAGLCLLLPLTRIVSQTLLAHLSEKAVYDLRMSLCERILATPQRRLEEVGGPTLLASLTGDVGAVTGAFTNLPFFFMQLAIVVGSLAYMAWLAWVPFLMFLGILLFAVVSIQLSEYPARRFMGVARQETDELYEHLRALTEGTKELKLHARRRESFIREVLDRTALSLRRNNVKGAGVYALSRGWTQLLFFAVLGASIFLLPRLAAMDAKSTSGYVLAILYISFPLDVVMSLFPMMSYANICVRKIESLRLSLADGEGARPEAAPAPRPPAPLRSLELRGVTHAYRTERENTTFELGPVSLRIDANELVFVTGGNGSGKTTLIKLLTGLYEPEGGELLLNGRPVTGADREQYRQHFSAVFSDFYLFEKLIGLDADGLDEEARRYIGKLQLEEKVEVKGGALSTINLSQGQRKRLALLTAYLEDRPVYVFDEWAADQDPHFREVFYYELLPELKERGKTIIVISHDDRYYHIADRVIKLEYGQVAYDRCFGREGEPLEGEALAGAAV
ncbi:MAG TPA: cyclic peptide export ABC transporter [Pyrinomonadaceae bacterium]|jgi:putative ATP-binding cassette transporter